MLQNWGEHPSVLEFFKGNLTILVEYEWRIVSSKSTSGLAITPWSLTVCGCFSHGRLRSFPGRLKFAFPDISL
jgi:hypothetical protein